METANTYNYTVVRQFAVMTVIWGIVGMAVGVVLAVGLVVPLLVRHEVAQREAVVTGDDVLEFGVALAVEALPAASVTVSITVFAPTSPHPNALGATLSVTGPQASLDPLSMSPGTIEALPVASS